MRLRSRAGAIRRGPAGGAGEERDCPGGGRRHLRKRAAPGAGRPRSARARRVAGEGAPRRAGHPSLPSERRRGGGRGGLISNRCRAANPRRRLCGRRHRRRGLPDRGRRARDRGESTRRPAPARAGARGGGDRALRGRGAVGEVAAPTVRLHGYALAGTFGALAALVSREIRRAAWPLWITPFEAALAICRTANASSCFVRSLLPDAAASRNFRTLLRSVDITCALRVRFFCDLRFCFSAECVFATMA